MFSCFPVSIEMHSMNSSLVNINGMSE